MNIFLDDERNPGQVTWVEMPSVFWTIVRSYDEFCKLLETEDQIDFVSFDHDLADVHYGHGLNDDKIPYNSYKEKTGMHCAIALTEWCMDNNKPLPDFQVHSMNPVGTRNIRGLLDQFRQVHNKT